MAITAQVRIDVSFMLYLASYSPDVTTDPVGTAALRQAQGRLSAVRRAQRGIPFLRIGSASLSGVRIQPICHKSARPYHAAVYENAVDHFESVAKYQAPPG